MVSTQKLYNKLSRIIIGKTEINNLSPHKARHSYATIALANNKPMAMVSKYLGYSTITITAKTYDHNVFSPDDFENGLIMGLN